MKKTTLKVVHSLNQGLLIFPPTMPEATVQVSGSIVDALSDATSNFIQVGIGMLVLTI